MKSSLWIIIALVTGIVGFLLGYSVSSFTGARSAGGVAAYGSPAADADASAPQAAGGYGGPVEKAAAGGYGGPVEKPKAAAGGYGGPVVEKPKAAAGGYGGPVEKPKQPPPRPAPKPVVPAAGY